MSLHLEHCANARCGRPYQVEQYSIAFAPLGQRAGVVQCPHCGTSHVGRPNKVYRTGVLDPICENWWVIGPTTAASSGLRVPR